MQAQRGAVLVQPLLQLRPFADERLVRELHRPLVDGHEPRVGESTDDRGDLALVGAGVLRECGSATRVLCVLAGLDEPQQHPAGENLLPDIDRFEDVIGGGRDCGPYAARTAIRIERVRATVARRPRGEQRV